MSRTLGALAERLRADDGLLAGAAVDPPAGAATPLGDAAAAGAATAARAQDYTLLVEAIREGYLAHYGEPRLLDSGDPDLDLLAGDHLYALGLDRLAELGDLASVEILAGVIARCAQAHAEGVPRDAQRAWEDGVASVAARGRPASGAGPNT